MESAIARITVLTIENRGKNNNPGGGMGGA